MNWNFLIPLGIIAVMSVLGYLMQMLKNASQKQEVERDRQRAEARVRGRQGNAPTANNDLDRFQRAIDAQRKKPAPKPSRNMDVVPTATPVKRRRVADVETADFPAAKTAPRATAAELPASTIVPMKATKPKQLAKLEAPKRASAAKTGTTVSSDAAPNPVAAQVQALLQGPNAMAIVMALQEVLGPPKSKRI